MLSLSEVQSLFQSDIQIVKQQQVANLWAGYGKAYRVQVKTQENEQSVIIKIVRPPKLKKSIADEGHLRKLNSYKVEAYFYENLSNKVVASGDCLIPQVVGVEFSCDLNLSLALSDLNMQGFTNEVEQLNLEQTKVTLKWLASFHAMFWECKCPEGVWEQGSYWYLDTRQSEYNRMTNKKLQTLAHKLDSITKGLDSKKNKCHKFRTLVHGDFKSENILFRKDSSACAAFDFQYVGEGYGARDVAYLLCSSTHRSVIEKYEQQLLKFYYDELIDKLNRKRKNKAQYLFDDFQFQFDVCLADYVRFMDGWGYWGNSSWAVARCKQFLQKGF
eukprot:TRINITY_DN12181_c1_g1_i10.p1 TRINITY_DN12181_c1_g1~~TRINITY_DN12181_c1_g1_i10.p1  ORF type:complete len:350 (-),score=34.75 TRINITY_DN12181_c1_g1_i10:23-1012(-)